MSFFVQRTNDRKHCISNPSQKISSNRSLFDHRFSDYMKNCAFVYLGLKSFSDFFHNCPYFSLLSERFVIDIYSCLLEQDLFSFIIFANDPLLAIES